MNEQDKNQFKTLMVGAGETYGKEVTKPLLQIYFGALQSYPIDDVAAAFSKHLVDPKHGTFFPKPADIVRQLSANEQSAEDKAALAWLQVENAIRRGGAYSNLELEDKQALAAVKNMGGWRSLCMSLESEMQWKRKEFISLYETFERTPIELLPSSLPGIAEIENHKKESKGQMKSLVDGMNKFRADHGLPDLGDVNEH